ncbi:MAG TPA: lipopolysaccharide heptosyltransferase II [Candidatus Eisenbacteria bacterium]|jgi:heptosyltransferase-2
MPPERILVRLPNWLGDVLLARPLLHGLRRLRPAADVRAVAPAALLELIAAERVITRGHPWPASPIGRRALVRELRAWRPDAALVLPPSFSSARFAWRTGAAVRIGYRQEWRGALLTQALGRPPRGDLHLSREYLALGESLGVREGPLPNLAPPPQAVDRRRDLLARWGLTARPSALLAPGASYGPAKRWGLDRFIALGRRLTGQGQHVLVCGAASERALCEQTAAGIGPTARSLAGETDLELQAALCAAATVVVSNDSGLAHLAAATGAPTIVIFGSTSSAWTAPLGPRVRIVQHPPACAPCFRRTCRIGYRCLAAVEVIEVARACQEIAA